MNRRYRKTIIAGNWKMNKTPSEARDFVTAIKPHLLQSSKWCDTVLCMPFIHLPTAVKAAKGGKIEIGAQNCHAEPSGAFTGEVSCGMLTASGVKYVIIGHSERRQYYGETDTDVNKKLHAALEAGLKPIVCVGESLQMRETEITIDHIRSQVKSAVFGVDANQLRRVVIAYEPIWAIGTGKTATAEQANEVCAAIRECLRQIYGARAARSVSILYGGSMNAKNAKELLSKPDIDGGLIGGASLKQDELFRIIEAANQ